MCKFEYTVHITQIDLFELSLTANVTLFFFKAAKGVLTAGPRKAVKYAGAKLKKMMKSQLKSWLAEWTMKEVDREQISVASDGATAIYDLATNQ